MSRDLCLEKIYSSPYFGEKLAATVTDQAEWEEMANADTVVFAKHLVGLEAHLNTETRDQQARIATKEERDKLVLQQKAKFRKVALTQGFVESPLPNIKKKSPV